ncbi:hypothetical protein Pres01_28580 [Metapseudomonas resinovorans]|nr:hypothetical protein Pres01_28580 [Pseudomonas resinovorans]
MFTSHLPAARDTPTFAEKYYPLMQNGHPKVAEAVVNGQRWPQPISPADICWALVDLVRARGTGSGFLS